MKEYYFTSEFVTIGHPDKICDQISDAILDACLSQDQEAKVACEVSVTQNFVLLFGEIKTSAKVDYEQIARDVIKEIGYDRSEFGFSYHDVEIVNKIHSQSQEINAAVVKEDKSQVGAGDQGLMFGYATNETKAYLPLAYYLAAKMARQLYLVRANQVVDYLRADGKVQVTICYDEKTQTPIKVDTVLLSTQHDANITNAQIQKDILEFVIQPVLEKYASHIDCSQIKYHINPSGAFVQGGPSADAGLTGRKIIVDTYGGYAPHGGGAFSGKDATKVDRSAAYMARYLAKNIVAAHLAKRCLIQLSYGIGLVEPISVKIDLYENENNIDCQKLSKLIQDKISLSPYNIIKYLDLKQPIYQDTAKFGHFTNKQASWEQLDLVNWLTTLK